MKKKRWARVPLCLGQLNFMKNFAVFLNFAEFLKLAYVVERYEY